MFKTQVTKTPLLGSQVLIKLPGSDSFSVGTVVHIPPGVNHDFLKVPIKMVVFDAADESVLFVSGTYGVEEGQWFHSGDFGIR